MQIKCENCSIIYEVSENHLIVRHPKFLKCTSCGHIFSAPQMEEVKQDDIPSIPVVEQTDTVPMSLSEIFQMPETANSQISKDEAIENPPTESIHQNTSPDLFAPFDSADEFMPITQSNKNHTKRLFWILSFITFLTLALIYLLYVGRYYFVRQVGVPPVLYQKSGIETNITGDGLAFQNSVFDIVKNQADFLLSVKSEVINTSDSIKNLPIVMVCLKDEKGNMLQKTSAELEKSSLNAGEVLPFEVRVHPIAQNARSIEITFEKENK